MERGLALPSLETLTRMCDALRCTPDDLLVPDGPSDATLRRLEKRLQSTTPDVARTALRAAEAILEYEDRALRR